MHTSQNSLHDIDGYAHCLATLFPSYQKNNDHWIGGWIKLSADELRGTVIPGCHLNHEVTSQEIRNYCIDLIIRKINHHTYGAGVVYELYEERRQEALQDLFQTASLSADEMILIKKECDYFEDMEPYRELCDCGATLDALQLAKSLHMEGQALCINCLVY